MTDLGDKAREDFFSEVQEIIEGLSRDLLALDGTARSGGVDPELINEVFRAVHTLKGLSGLFNAVRIGALSHELENLLNDLRMGRLDLTPEVLDVLFRGVELYQRLLAAEKAGPSSGGVDEFDGFVLDLQKLATHDASDASTVVYDLDPGMLAVLTEYEEHRLRTNLQRGMLLFRVRVVFQLSTIDSGLEDLKSRLKEFGEILTYLPTGSGADAESIEIDILLASPGPLEVLRAAQGPNAQVDEVPRRSHATHHPGPIATPLPPAFPPRRDPTSIPPPSVLVRPSALPPRPASDTGALARRPDATLRSVAQTVRVDIQKLDHLMSLLAELAILKGNLGRVAEKVRQSGLDREIASELARLNHSLDRHLSAMQSGILEVRMVPLGQVFDKLARVVRQVSRELDKEGNLVITGAETEVDKLIVEELSDPLMHMVRNALDHGIETKHARELVGKPPAGTIALNAYQKGNQVVVEVEDDGSGIDPAALLKAALDRGVISQDDAAEMSPVDALQLVFLPGVTTRTDVGKLSGRGVGMDVVKTNIGKLGGVVDVHSEMGIGTKFTITLPITLAIISALLVGVGDSVYAVPLASVREAVTLDSATVRFVEGHEIVTLRGETLPICRLDVLFHVRPPPMNEAHKKLVVVIASAASRRVGFVVDRILGRQDIVIKALGGPLRTVRGFAGATDFGDERVGLVLDVPTLIEEAMNLSRGMVAHV